MPYQEEYELGWMMENEQEFGPGEAMHVPPGHDAWVVGNEPFVAIDITSGKEYATFKEMSSIQYRSLPD